MELNKKFDYYIIKCEFKLVFNDYQNCPYVMSNVSVNKNNVFLEEFFDESD